MNTAKSKAIEEAIRLLKLNTTEMGGNKVSLARCHRICEKVIDIALFTQAREYEDKLLNQEHQIKQLEEDYKECKSRTAREIMNDFIDLIEREHGIISGVEFQKLKQKWVR